ncbi:hypothetical protein ABKN59_011237 [Abortiporus biennis]
MSLSWLAEKNPQHRVTLIVIQWYRTKCKMGANIVAVFETRPYFNIRTFLHITYAYVDLRYIRRNSKRFHISSRTVGTWKKSNRDVQIHLGRSTNPNRLALGRFHTNH